MNEKVLLAVEQVGLLVAIAAGVLIGNTGLGSVDPLWSAIVGIIVIALATAGLVASYLRGDRPPINDGTDMEAR